MAASVDYGYGDTPQTDYGYGDSNPDYGYGDSQPDYGYGDAAKPAEPDYGYGDSKKPTDDFGYGDAKPDEPSAQEDRRPKRRCSVTRYSIAPQQAPLNAAAVIADFRNGAAVETLVSEQAPASIGDSCDDVAGDNKAKSKGRGLKAMFRRGK